MPSITLGAFSLVEIDKQVFDTAIITGEIANNGVMLNTFLSLAQGKTLTEAWQYIKQVYGSEKRDCAFKYTKKLKESGLIVQAKTLAKGRKVYTLTERGQVVYALLLNTIKREILHYANKNAKPALSFFKEKNNIFSCVNSGSLYLPAIEKEAILSFLKDKLKLNPALLPLALPEKSVVCKKSFSWEDIELKLVLLEDLLGLLKKERQEQQ